ncbi:hypothetical protein HUU62_03815 [Rhodoferax sp. 4810]|uniref:Uncharacterized protein n=1 Tax=Thiospirillum jenense TaxID=1653858 RepID=A0A839H9Y7_9GAMM|nr:hypothetical protein [Thiospirillum jenense]MBB1073535.1 hypothetical protein [Rhodoferax jenense]MBB1126023.1 hypothetical protein [Thiospirillum jenense]
MGWNSNENDLETLKTHAQKALAKTLTEEVRKAAKGKIDVLTIGIDLIANDESERHAELVAVCELASGYVFWTGKSYPTGAQERHLIQVVDLKTHLLKIAGEQVFVLGCHDLNMFSPRGRANQKTKGRRWQRCEETITLAKQFQPTIVLQHPHSTDSPNIWRTAWAGLIQELPDVKAWASGIAYHHWDDQQEPRGSLDEVLIATQGGMQTVDFIVS